MKKNHGMRIKYSKKFKKQFERVDKKIKLAFEERLRLFAVNPQHPMLRNHQLTGQLQAYHSINITGDWRAIYSLSSVEGGVICLFEMIGTHSQLYR